MKRFRGTGAAAAAGRVSGALILALAFFPSLLHAQNLRFEIFGAVGAASTNYTPTLSTGRSSGLSLSGGVGLRPFAGSPSGLLAALGFEGEVTRFSTERFPGEPGPLVIGTHTDTQVTGSLLAHFGARAARGFVLIGGGRRWVSGWDRVDGIVQFGFGAHVFVTPSVSVRPEMRVSTSALEASALRFSFGAAYHW